MKVFGCSLDFFTKTQREKNADTPQEIKGERAPPKQNTPLSKSTSAPTMATLKNIMHGSAVDVATTLGYTPEVIATAHGYTPEAFAALRPWKQHQLAKLLVTTTRLTSDSGLALATLLSMGFTQPTNILVNALETAGNSVETAIEFLSSDMGVNTAVPPVARPDALGMDAAASWRALWPEWDTDPTRILANAGLASTERERYVNMSKEAHVWKKLICTKKLQ